jgi:hypothetical protein
MPKKNTFFGANIPYADISVFYNQGTFSYFVIQSMMADGEKDNDDYTIVLWAIDTKGSVMPGINPIMPRANSHELPAKKKVQFANGYLTKRRLAALYVNGPFTLELKPVEYKGDKDYVSFEIYNADLISLTPKALDTIDPSPPASFELSS